MLCRALRAGGLRHVYEVGHPFYRAELAKNYGPDLTEAPVSKIVDRLKTAQPREHVAIKLFYPDMQEIVKTRAVDDFTFIYLERRDLSSQVISILAMWATGRAIDMPVTSLPFDTMEPTERNAKIAISYLRSNRRLWRSFLAAHPVHNLFTEDVIADPETSFRNLSAYLAGYGVRLETEATSDVVRNSKRYEQDADLKAELRERFQPLLATLDKKAT